MHGTGQMAAGGVGEGWAAVAPERAAAEKVAMAVAASAPCQAAILAVAATAAGEERAVEGTGAVCCNPTRQAGAVRSPLPVGALE